jgi:dCTP deaminase
MGRGDIIVTPFDEVFLSANSYNLHLNSILEVYTEFPLDPRKKNPTKSIEIPPEGIVLQPGILYLGSTIEKTNQKIYVPELEGRSSSARLGISPHVDAGFGDIGFNGHWTLEITVVQPSIVYFEMGICKIMWHECTGEDAILPEEHRYSAYGRYQNNDGVQTSRMYLDGEQKLR